MGKFPLPESEIISRHPFTRRGIRLWLPLMMAALILICGWIAAPRIGLFEFIIFIFLFYVVISAMVSVCEITVIKEGLIIDRLMLPERFVPWNAIDRVVVFEPGESAQLELASIGMFEGLSPLNRLPGLVYGQGFRQTIIITPDTVDDYDELLATLNSHCQVQRITTPR